MNLWTPLVPFGPALSTHIYHTQNICSLPENPGRLLVGVARRTLSFVGILKPTESAEGSGFLWKCTQELLLLKAQANSSVLCEGGNIALLGCWTISVLAPCFLTALAPATIDTHWWVYLNHNPAITLINKDIPEIPTWRRMTLLTFPVLIAYDQLINLHTHVD